MFQCMGRCVFVLGILFITCFPVSCGAIKDNSKKIRHSRSEATVLPNADALPEIETIEDKSPGETSAENSDSVKNIKVSGNQDISEDIQDNGLRDLIDGIETIVTENPEEGNFPVCDGVKTPNAFCPRKHTVENGGMAFVCSEQSYSLVKNPDRFVAVNPFADTLWPGSLIQTRPLIRGILNPVPVSARSPGSVTMTLAAEGPGNFSENILSPSLSSVTESIRKILSQNSQIATPARFNYEMHRVYSSEQLGVAMGLRLETPVNLGIETEFRFNSEDTKSRILIDFTQEYYTMAYTPGPGFYGFFLPEVEPADLGGYISEGNPLSYISSVTYGRKLWLMFESDATITDLEASLKASFQGYGVGVEAGLATKYKNVLNEAHIKAWVIGGNAEEALSAMNQVDDSGISFVNLKNLLAGGANFSKGNPGLPISYTVRHVRDSSQIRLILNTEYTAKECHPVADVQNPVAFGLSVTLEKVEIEKENGFCEILHETGEFRPCLEFMQGNESPSPVFCSGEIRKAKPGDILLYGQSNHTQEFEILQKPGETFSVKGSVHEVDGNNSDEIVGFSKKFMMSDHYEWTGWQDQFTISGSFEGCRATMTWSMKWNDQFLAKK